MDIKEFYQVNYNYISNFTQEENSTNGYVKANNSIEAERIARTKFDILKSINKIIQFKNYFTSKYWFTFCEDGVWIFADEYPYKTKREAVEALRFAKLDDRKRVISKITDGFYVYNRCEGQIIRGDKIVDYGYLQHVIDFLQSNS